MAVDRQQGLHALVGRLPLFAALGSDQLRRLLAQGVRRPFSAGQELFREGTRAKGLYVVLAGRVKVFKVSPRGREQILMLMGPGEPVGEAAVLSGETYPASAQALEDTETLYLPRRAFLELVAGEPEVTLRLLAALSARLRSFASLIEDLALRDVSQRLAAHLLSLADGGGAPSTGHRLSDGQDGRSRGRAASGLGERAGTVAGEDGIIHLPLSKAQLSAAMGTVPETLSRAFQQLAKAGALETRGRLVVIKDRPLLERLAGNPLAGHDA